jgi:predicted nucleic acid-binding protein
MKPFDVLIDSDAFVGWLSPNDAHHEHTSVLFAPILQQTVYPVTTSWVVAETATVLSRRDGQAIARLFLDRLKTVQFPIIHITEQLQRLTTEFFVAHDGKAISMVDCSNVVVMREFHIPKILSFDKFYARNVGLPEAV